MQDGRRERRAVERRDYAQAAVRQWDTLVRWMGRTRIDGAVPMPAWIRRARR